MEIKKTFDINFIFTSIEPFCEYTAIYLFFLDNSIKITEFPIPISTLCTRSC